MNNEGAKMIATISLSDVTEWYPADVKPVRKGWYEVRNAWLVDRRSHRLVGRMRFFNGKTWRAGWTNELVSIFGEHASHQWRGLRSPA